MWFRRKRRSGVNGKSVSKTRWLPKILLVLLVLVILISGGFFLTSEFFSVKNLEVKTENVNCATSEDLKNNSQILGKNIFLIDGRKTEKVLKERYICIKNATLVKIISSKVRLDIFGRMAAAQILVFPPKEGSAAAILDDFLAKKSASESGQIPQEPQRYFLADSEGVVFSEERVHDKPQLYVWDDSLGVGQKIGEDVIKKSLEVISKIGVLTITVTEAKLYSNQYLLIDAKPKLIFDLRGNINQQLASLQLILSRAKIEEANMELIDLRFENPVVKYIPKKN